MTLRERLEKQLALYRTSHAAFKEVSLNSTIQFAREASANLMHEYTERILHIQAILDADEDPTKVDQLREVINETYAALVKAGPDIGDLATKGLPYAVNELVAQRDRLTQALVSPKCPNCENGSGYTRRVGLNNDEIVEDCLNHVVTINKPFMDWFRKEPVEVLNVIISQLQRDLETKGSDLLLPKFEVEK